MGLALETNRFDMLQQAINLSKSKSDKIKLLYRSLKFIFNISRNIELWNSTTNFLINLILELNVEETFSILKVKFFSKIFIFDGMNIIIKNKKRKLLKFKKTILLIYNSFLNI